VVATEENARLNQVVDAIANGVPVDWSALPDAEGDLAGGTLGALRAIAGVSKFYRERNVADTEASLGDVLVAGEAASRVEPGARPDLSRGEPWDRLIKLERIGGGSFGDVYRAWDPMLEKVVALKLTRYSSGHDATRALNEAQRLARIPPHPNVITVYGAHRIGNDVGIWMEFLRGRTLESIVADQGELSGEEATYYGACLCRALAHVHAGHVLHRDVKAANVVKAAGGRVVLIDFGSGQEIVPAGAPDPKRLVGTLPYMAPELFRREPATAQSDIYSLGVLLFNLVTDKYPVTASSPEGFAEAHRLGRRSGLHDVRSDLPMPFVQVVERAIDPDVERRYKTAGELLRALDQQGGPAPSPKSSVDTWSTRVLWALLILSGGLTGIGLVTTRAFNVALGRSDFTVETVTDWFQMGWMASVKPAFIGVVAFLGIQLLSGGKRLGRAMFPRAGQLEARCRTQLGHAARRTRLDDTSVVGAWLLLLSIIALGSVWWSFSDLLGTVATTRISTASIEDLGLLSPSSRPYYDWYREMAAYTTVVLVAVWYYMARHIRQTSGSLKNGFLLGGGFVVCVSIVSLDLPYRLIQHPVFVAAHWNDNDCYIIGERSNDLLLFCPMLTPRSRVVQKGEKIERFDVRNIFEKFGRQDGK